MILGVPNRQLGFTFVELVVVIVVLSVLAAFAVPRLLDVTSEAHTNVMKSVTGAFSTATASARAQWYTEGGSGSTVTFDGETLPVSENGWPTPVTGTTDCTDLWSGMLQDPPDAIPFALPLTKGDGFSVITIANPTIAYCLYVYRPTWPNQPMWMIYYAHFETWPQYNGRIWKSGF